MKVAIIGSGFSSLASACYLAKAGYEVALYEKNSQVGGRARQLKTKGFTFDIGPTWYWMPDVFEKFFQDFGKRVEDYYQLEKLSPAYKVFFGQNNAVEIADSLAQIEQTFEEIEPGSGKKLHSFIDEARNNYEIAIKDLVYRPGDSILELITPKTVLKVSQFFSTISKTVKSRFRDKRLQQILEFPILFLGAKPSNTPGFYNFMNYADFGLGTWHPKGGMYSVVEAMEQLAIELGVTIHINATVEKINVVKGKVTGLQVNKKNILADIVLSGADYHFTETLLAPNLRQYSEQYWNKKTFAPSSLLFYVGFDKKIAHVKHHTLFFDAPFEEHAIEIYDTKKWPKNPLFYASFPSITDDSFAPKDKEAAIFLIPLAIDLEDTPEIREQYFEKIITRFEKITNQSVREHILVKESFCVNDFKNDYNSYKGNAYGLANILTQTAFLRPKIKSKKVKNLYFTGQLTVPGPGVPPSLISGKIASDKISKENKL
ncbi:phytoene desaturase family protein [Flavobacterium aciduliphilum]|uniref:Phytoene desaturase n=1 Tax=Flavobacterium aciduliphilum TaxID=1101402 RepID=A0A328YNP0_9FLAO|nr:phytoene desaturase family protein [Flavobacterium aciduliphilum]RAR75661.1 phytoene desaturase [Flavobacterium aciduliphilum]